MKDQEYYLNKAQENLPKMHLKTVKPQIDKIAVKTGDSFVLDFGEHLVGYFSFSFDVVGDFIDAPTKLTVKFGEDMREINDDFSQYKGTLSDAWLQEETLFLDYPQTVKMPRRYSCRYVKITVQNTRQPINIYDFCFTSQTSADVTVLAPCKTSDPLLRKIDEVSTTTLKECMQTFFEDGPKRDRRLWIGDLRLEALTNYYTFNNLEITRRCLYLLAAGKYNDLGLIPSYIYETPYFVSGRSSICDYALLYVVSVCDYYQHTKDLTTVMDLIDICKDQLDNFEKLLDDNLIIQRRDGWFFFIDWCPGLSGLVALQGVYLYALRHFIDLLSVLGDNDSKKYEQTLEKVKLASKKHLFNEELGAFIHGIDGNQLSVHSQVWMILGGVIDGKDAEKALDLTLNSKEAKRPVTPYMWHYVLEAMFKLGRKKEATELIKSFWGSMIEQGCDTFYEVNVPGNPDFSPYGDRMINSLCHAWSCSPAYFIRKYGL